MNDPKNIAAGILARGKAMHEASGAKSVICSCERVGIYRCEAHGDANRRKEAEKLIPSVGVTELCANHNGLHEYIGQLEKERDHLRSQLEALAKAKEVSLAECGRLRELLGEVRPLIPSKMSCRDNGRTSSWYDANDELRDRIDAELRTGEMVADPAKEEAAKVEAMAKEIYDKFHFTPDGDYKTKPAWVDGGNSIMQDEARKRARAILKTQSSGPGK